jgi:small GTP-binding protein
VIQKKIALLGAPGVGKTSLVRRFVESLFDEKYLTTIGVKVDKKTVQVRGQDVLLMIWDIAGAEESFSVPISLPKISAANDISLSMKNLFMRGILIMLLTLSGRHFWWMATTLK